MRNVFVAVVAAVAMLFSGQAADAQARKNAPPPVKEFSVADRELLNANTVTVISGNPNGTYLPLAFDIAAVLDDGDKLRVLPVGGKGGYQNVKDLLFLKGVDIAITQSNILTHLKKTGEMGRSIEQRLTYITKLYNEELHVLAAEGINRLEDLEGKTVNLSDPGSGTQFSSRLILAALNINVTEVNMGQSDGFEALKSGKIAATFLIAGKPAGSFGRFKLEPGMKLLTVPYVEALENDYFPSRLTHQDYPNLISQGQTVNTVAVGAVLATINWQSGSDRYRRVSKFTEALFAKFGQFKVAPRHPKWKEISLATELTGWTRFPTAKAQLDTIVAAEVATKRAQPAAATAAAPPSRKTFEQFLADQKGSGATPATESSGDMNVLYARFVEWMKTQPGGAPPATGAAAPGLKAPAAAPTGPRLW